jgi:hypothetical protein
MRAEQDIAPRAHISRADCKADRPLQLAEREAEVEPDGMADNLGREAIPGVAGASGCRHPTRLPTPACRRNRGKPAKLTVPRREMFGDEEQLLGLFAVSPAIPRSILGSGQPIQLHRASPMTSSRSRPFSHGSASVNKVTHCRQEQGIRVMSVPQNIRSGPNASKQRCEVGSLANLTRLTIER